MNAELSFKAKPEQTINRHSCYLGCRNASRGSLCFRQIASAVFLHKICTG
jgi:hypothetical protein